MTGHDADLDELQATNDLLLAYAAYRARGGVGPFEHETVLPGHRDLIARELSRLEAREPAARMVGRYRLERELGRGAFGHVSLAVDTATGRRVALKVVSLQGDDQASIERLRREVDAMARVDDPCVCPVYDVGSADGVAWIAMRHIAGESLAQRISAQTAIAAQAGAGPRRCDAAERQWILEFFERAARGLHRVHEAGFVHRDIKPSNVMIDADRRPVLLDFGVVREVETDRLDLTSTGDVLGTPSYMAPELVGGQARRADARADVYSLGATMFETLTLRRPFEAPSRELLYRAILEHDLPDPRRLCRDVPRVLSIVLQTALDKNPDRRYATALEFAEDLQRVADHRPIRARRAGPLLVLARMGRRHKALTTGLVLLFTALVALAAQQFLANRDIAAERDRATAELHRARAFFMAGLAARVVERWPERATWYAHLSLQMLDSQIARSMLYRAFQRQQVLRVMHGQEVSSRSLETSTDGRTMLTAGRWRDACVWDTATGELRHRLTADAANVTRIALSTDGHRAAIATADDSVQVWNAVTGQPIHRHHAEAPVAGIALSADGTMVAIGSADGRIQLVTDDGLQTSWSNGTDPIVALRFDPASDRIAALDTGGGVSIAACLDGAPLTSTDLVVASSPPPDSRSVVHWLIDGTVLAFLPGAPITIVVPETGSVTPVDTAGWTAGEPVVDPTGTFVVVPLRQPGAARLTVLDIVHRQRFEVTDAPLLTGVAITPDGRRVIGWQDSDPIIRWIDLATGRRGELLGHTSGVRAATFLADGSLVTADRDWTLRIWDLRAPPQRSVAELPIGAINIALSPDGERVLFRHDGRILLADTRTGAVTAEFPVRRATALGFHGTQRVIGVTSDEIVVYAIDGSITKHLPRPATTVRVGHDPTGRWLATWSFQTPITVFDLDAVGTEPTSTIDTTAGTISGVWLDSAAGELIAADGDQTNLRTWSLANGGLRSERRVEGPVWHVCTPSTTAGPEIVRVGSSLRGLPLSDGPAQTFPEMNAVEQALRRSASGGLVITFDRDELRLYHLPNELPAATIGVPLIVDVAIRADEIIVLDGHGMLHAFPIDIVNHVTDRALIEPRPAVLVEDEVIEPRSIELFEAVSDWIDRNDDLFGLVQCEPMLADDQRRPALERYVAVRPESFRAWACLAVHLELQSARDGNTPTQQRELAAATERAMRQALTLLGRTTVPTVGREHWKQLTDAIRFDDAR